MCRFAETFATQDESKRLLETAKRAVEIAIEQNENTAMEFTSANTK